MKCTNGITRLVIGSLALLLVFGIVLTKALGDERSPLGPGIDVRDFGAKGDGFTDDTAAIQSALDAAHTDGVSPVYIPRSGSCYIITQIKLRDNDRLYGDGYHSCLKLKDSANLSMIVNYDEATAIQKVVIRSLRLDGNKANQSIGNPHGIALRGCQYCLFETLWVENPSGDGIVHSRTANVMPDIPTDWIIRNVQVSGFKRNGISVIESERFLIANTYTFNSDAAADPGAGIDLEINDVHSLISYGHLVNITAFGNVGSGIILFGDTGGTLVTNNSIIGCSVSQNTRHGIYIYYAQFTSVELCSSWGNSGDGFKIFGFARFNSFLGNKAVSNTGFGFHELADGVNSPDFNTFVGNLSRSNTGGAYSIIGPNSIDANNN